MAVEGGAGMVFPRQDGDVTVLGPEVFVSSDGSVISWRGENYYRDDAAGRFLKLAARLLEEGEDDLLDAASFGALVDEDGRLADKGFRTLFSPDGREALRTLIARQR